MRGLVPNLASPVPLITQLPAILQEDEFLDAALPAFDDLIAPVYSTLDNLDAYVRPEYAPSDFLEWLAGWVGVALEGEWTEEQRRRIVADAVALHRRVGTAGGIRDAMELAAGPGATVEVEESGGTSWSTEPGGAVPGSAEPGIAISVTVPGGNRTALARRFERVAAGVVPAYLPIRLSVSVSEAPPAAQ
ncbi:phage tail protein [Agromyces sp. Marseille-P2726]|uniref:phage tail protein n=1 Tax=Agromyces sp. Marseille-P2726 TaxID=2709132 RepID=UPI00156E9911|nr:phage tail protein [Agromyces sp. Marseille-P2726]